MIAIDVRSWACALLVLGAPVSADAEEEQPARMANFSLRDAQGNVAMLYDRDEDVRGTVLAWTSLDCMVAKLYLPKLVEMAEDYEPEGIRFFGVNPNIQDEPEEIVARMAKVGVDFPILTDPMQAVTDKVEIERTTEVILLDADFRVVYRGAIDDQYNVGASKPFARHEWLVEAIECLIAEEEIETARTEPAGCLVGRIVDRSQIELSYSRDVAPILDRNCVQCHRPDQIGPMSLLDGDDARGWAPMIAEVVSNGTMPPWHADPLHGEYRDQRFLTETDKQILITWAENGAPLGDLAERPAPPTFDDEGWAIGKPDHVIQLPEVQQIPATGYVDYRYVIVDPQITEDRWVQSMEVRPTSTAATHHVLVLLIPPDGGFGDRRRGGRGRGRSRDEDDGDGGGSGYFAVQVPGCRPNVYPEGMGKLLPAGSRLMFQMHYTPTGIATEDQTRMAFRWCDEVPETEVRTLGIYHNDIDIPPGKKDATFYAHHTLDQSIKMLSMFPHMHARGASFTWEVRDDSEERVLLDVPVYDFNWQHFYSPVEPIEIEEGQTLHITAVFDNSEDNPANPDPSKRVRWGDQTFEEMMIGYMDYIDVQEPPR